jgi:hypothetical protein
MMVVRVSGTVKKWTIWTKPPRMSWTQMDHLGVLVSNLKMSEGYLKMRVSEDEGSEDEGSKDEGI